MSIIPHTCDAGGVICVGEIGGTIFLSEGLLWKWGVLEGRTPLHLVQKVFRTEEVFSSFLRHTHHPFVYYLRV